MIQKIRQHRLPTKLKHKTVWLLIDTITGNFIATPPRVITENSKFDILHKSSEHIMNEDFTLKHRVLTKNITVAKLFSAATARTFTKSVLSFERESFRGLIRKNTKITTDKIEAKVKSELALNRIEERLSMFIPIKARITIIDKRYSPKGNFDEYQEFS